MKRVFKGGWLLMLILGVMLVGVFTVSQLANASPISRAGPTTTLENQMNVTLEQSASMISIVQTTDLLPVQEKSPPVQAQDVKVQVMVLTSQVTPLTIDSRTTSQDNLTNISMIRTRSEKNGSDTLVSYPLLE